MARSQSSGMLATVGMIFIILSVSVIVPAIFVSLESPQTTAYQQRIDERVAISGELSGQVTNISTVNDSANVSLLDTSNGSYASTGEIDAGNETNVTVSGETVTVKVIEIVNSDEAVISYEYPVFIGWPSGAGQIIDLIPQIILLFTTVLLAGVILVVANGVSFNG